MNELCHHVFPSPGFSLLGLYCLFGQAHFASLHVSAGAVETTEDSVKTTCLWEAWPDSSPSAGFRHQRHTLVSKVCSFYQLPYKRPERESSTTDQPATSHGGHRDQRLLWTVFIIVSQLCGKSFHKFWEVFLVGEGWTVSSLDLLRLGVWFFFLISNFL